MKKLKDFQVFFSPSFPSFCQAKKIGNKETRVDLLSQNEIVPAKVLGTNAAGRPYTIMKLSRCRNELKR